ncbi:MAG: FlgD immunoglobulin-like domain containing protein [Candidatus Eisenbacteria bacterium]
MRGVALLLLSICLAARASATTVTSIPVSTTWTLAGSPYVITPGALLSVSVPAGVTLTIDPGVVVQFKPGKALSVANGGSLVAVGQPGQAILFQSELSGDPWAGVQCAPGAALSMSDCTFETNGGYPVRGTIQQVASLFATNAFVPSPDGRFNAIELIGGTVTANTTLKSPQPQFCYITARFANLNIAGAGGPTLTVEPGVLKFEFASGLSATNGGLQANGVTFTSGYDDFVCGDTNGDGPPVSVPAPHPAPGDWIGLQFVSTNALATSSLVNCDVRFAGSQTFAYGVRVAFGARPTITGGAFHHNRGSGLRVESPSSGAQISGLTLRDNTEWELAAAPAAMAQLVGQVTCERAVPDAFNGYQLLAGTITSNTLLPGLPPGFCYTVESNADIVVNHASGPVLTIGAGVVKFAPGSRIGVANGGLQATDVTFTSVNDDIGGDTNGDGDPVEGSAPPPAGGQWIGIDFAANGTAATTALTNCEIRYAGSEAIGYGVRILGGAEPSITGGSISDNRGSGILVGDASSCAQITGVRVRDNGAWEVTAPMAAMVALATANSIEPSDGTAPGESGLHKFDAYHVVGGLVDADIVLPRPPVPMCYYFDGDITIAAGRTLQVLPGTVIKMGIGDSLQVLGTLRAEGAVLLPSLREPIVFTSIRDDFWLGDTPGDGLLCGPQPPPPAPVCHSTGLTPAPADWARVVLTAGHGNLLRGAVFRYGGFQSAGQLRIVGTPPDGAPQDLVEHCFFYVDAPRGGGVVVKGSRPRIVDSAFLGVSTSFGIETQAPGFEVDARGNWWGAPSGPNDDSANLSCNLLTNAGAGVRVSDCVDYGGFLVQPGQAPVTDAPPRPVPSVGRLGVSVRPNPVRRAAEFHVERLAGDLARIEVLDASGRRVWSEELEPETEGERALRWDLTTAQGQRVRPGLYFVRVTTARASYSRHLVVIE